MADDLTVMGEVPRNWCFDCGKPLWDWSTVRRTESLIGPVILCKDCATRHPGNREAKATDSLMGWKDKQRLTRAAKRKGKR